MEPDSLVIVGCSAETFEECQAYLLAQGCRLDVIYRKDLKSIQDDIDLGICQPAMAFFVTPKENVQDPEYFLGNKMFMELSQRMMIFVTPSPEQIKVLLQTLLQLPGFRDVMLSAEEEQDISRPSNELAQYKPKPPAQKQWEVLYQRGHEQGDAKGRPR